MICTLYNITLGVCVLVLYLFFKFCRKAISIAAIRGPLSPSWLLGHMYMTRHTKKFGDYEVAWYRDYGSVFRIAGVFQLHFSYIRISVPKSLDADRFANAFFGYGLVTAAAAVRSTETHLKAKITSGSLVEKLKEKLNNGDETQDVLTWMEKVALDIIGKASFRYSFDALDNKNYSLETILRNLLADAQLFPSVIEVLVFHGVLGYLPESVVAIMAKLPTREKSGVPELVKDSIEEGKDIVNIVALSSLSDDEKKKMPEKEVVAQMVTFIFAGHDTTANSSAWLLYELSRHAEVQDEVRQEILQARRDKGGVLNASDYDAMPLLNAVIKAMVFPRMTSSRNPIVWGDSDADQWNPNRFLKGDQRLGDTTLGVFANLMTFSLSLFFRMMVTRADADSGAGIRACIGWRFTIMELQTISVDLLSAFSLCRRTSQTLFTGQALNPCSPCLTVGQRKYCQPQKAVFLLSQIH
ncbi:cytochrome P450 [Hymenopellis radicata]|nr:cytochrome P450 [Hymenopellis radicata]